MLAAAVSGPAMAQDIDADPTYGEFHLEPGFDPDPALLSGMAGATSALSNADTTLVVNGPDGTWYCDDDGGEDSNPSVELTPDVGRYEIWIGTCSKGEIKKAVPGISEVTSF